jgi:thiamine-monophosphate kinase
MNELRLVETIRRICRKADARGVRLGIGDDCAVLRPAPGEDLLVTTDYLIEGVHFPAGKASPRDAGWKALARGLSDIAAMGGVARYGLVSLALGPKNGESFVRAFYQGMQTLARRHGVTIVGGDVTQARGLAVDVVVLGGAPRGKEWRRDGARPHDQIYVTGTLGGAALGLETGNGAAWKRHLRPEPRLAQAARMRKTLPVRACIDLSDGLALDLHRLCVASGVAAELDWRLPLFPGASLRHAVEGGEDYELLFTVPPRRSVPEEVEGVPLTRIGEIVAGKPGSLHFAGRPLRPLGWDPFAGRRR